MFKHGQKIEISDHKNQWMERVFIGMTSDDKYLCWTLNRKEAVSWKYARPIHTEWYNNIPEQGVLCWVWDESKEHKTLRVILSFNRVYKSKYSEWLNATPIKPEELYNA